MRCYNEIMNFMNHINQYSEQEILNKMQYIREFFKKSKDWETKKDCINKIFEVVDKNKILHELFLNDKKFIPIREKLDFPENLKFGVEIEISDLSLEEIQDIFSSNIIYGIMEILEVPTEISNKIILNSDFEKKNEFNKWIFSKEMTWDSEASSPIMKNNLEDLNQIVAICTLLKALGAEVDGGCGLHINVGVDYLECREKAIENLLKIWGECEEIFFKIANPEGEEIRIVASDMAIPVKGNIQTFFEQDGSVTLNTEEDFDRFLYQIQAQNRMEKLVELEDFDENLEWELRRAKNEEQVFNVFKKYQQYMKKKENEDSKIRYTSINFNHMKWNEDESGRIELRIFNSSLEPEIIMQDLLLVGKLFDISLKNAKDSNYKKEELQKLFLHNMNEEEKVKALVDVLFDEQKQKEIFVNRWKSVKNNKYYEKFISGSDTFQRE